MNVLRGTAVDLPATKRRVAVRYVAAALSIATALIYFAIGFGIVSVVDKVREDGPPMLAFGGSAGAAFVFGAALLVLFDRRVLWILGAILQLGVIVMYFNVAPQRSPSFEMWGILVKILQVLILAALAYLVVRPAEPARA